MTHPKNNQKLYDPKVDKKIPDWETLDHVSNCLTMIQLAMIQTLVWIQTPFQFNSRWGF